MLTTSPRMVPVAPTPLIWPQRQTFQALACADWRDHLVIQIGGDGSVFAPEVRLTRWRAASLALRLRTRQRGVVRLVRDRIIWQANDLAAHFYPLPATEIPEGGYEFAVIWGTRPESNVLEFDLELRGLDLLYQPVSAPAGTLRPEHVRGSYAVYWRHAPLNYTGGPLYRCGKICHFYRPWALDALNRFAWADMAVRGDLLTITVPQTFLNQAAYPVKIDPTIGYTTAGGSIAGLYENYVVGCCINSTVSGNSVIESISQKIYQHGGYPLYWRNFITNNSNTILTDGVTTAQETNEAQYWNGWKTATYSSKPSVNSGSAYYPWLVSGTWTPFLYYDHGSANDDQIEIDNNYTTPTNPTSTVSDGVRYSLYATYLLPGQPAAMRWRGIPGMNYSGRSGW